MEKEVIFISAKEAVINFFKQEYESFPNKLLNQFLSSFSHLSSYEEEGDKIRPNIVFTNNIDALIRAVPLTYKVPLFEDENETTFSLRMKALLPFCKEDWTIYISIKDDQINYGVVKTLNSIKEESFLKLVSKSEVLKQKTDKISAIIVESFTSNTVVLKSLKGERLNINFSLDVEKFNKWEDEIKEFVEASFSKLRTTEKKLTEIKTMYQNVFEKVFKNVHGALCVVVDKDYVDNGFFSDGIWLKEPISFSKLFMQSKSYSEAKLTSFCDLFISMLNFDGITIVDNTGTIRAYNVFVETNTNKLQKITGGARKRAAYTVINSRRRKIMGVYFQSRDGDVFYKKIKR
ncbi:MAG: hypothetical protein ACOX6H_01320 [Christensenellales bacterium]|jgi:hypothetical protein